MRTLCEHQNVPMLLWFGLAQFTASHAERIVSFFCLERIYCQGGVLVGRQRASCRLALL